MSNELKVFVVYDWIEDIDMAKHPKILVGLLEDAGVTPNKATFFVGNERKERRRTIYKKSRLFDVIAPFTNYDWVAFDETVAGNFLNLNSHLSWTAKPRRLYQLARRACEKSDTEIIRHLRLLCQFVSPRYGFSYVGNGAEALFFVGGISSSKHDLEKTQRISDLSRSLIRTKEHLSGYLHDVYALNVLSPLHLSCPVSGEPLRLWIESGGRGQLVEIKEDVHVWLVPDEVRPQIRAQLFDEGILIASV